jgi:NADH-quinone oxidoreductase subunit N
MGTEPRFFPTFPTIPAGDLGLSMLAFLPETVICGGIVLLLLLRLFEKRSHVGSIALTISLAALFFSVCQFPRLASLFRQGDLAHDIIVALQGQRGGPIFQNLLLYDNLTIYIRCFLYAFTALVIWLSMTTGIPDREDSADFYTLLLGATLGMAIMGSACHLLMLYIGVEMASLPSYALAGYLKGKRQSSEAALKYVVYGGGASGVMLFGISLLTGKFGTGYLPLLSLRLADSLPLTTASGTWVDGPVVLLGGLFLLVGIAFKLAAVPFHFWCPDVFEGAAAEVAGYLSVASKAAALAMLARVVSLIAGLDLNLIAQPLQGRWLSIGRFLIPALAFFAALTATFGNLAAYLQTNLKRLLAYSTIAHAGYMLMALAALTREGVGAVLFYLVAYLFMNLGAFAVVAYLRNLTGSEDLSSFRGLVRRAPWMVLTLSLFLLSLLGVPPLIGFAAKFVVFSALFHGGQEYYIMGQPGLGAILYGLLVIGGINTVISAVYYVKVMKVMILDRRAEDLEDREPVRLHEPVSGMVYAGVLAVVVFGLGLAWGPVDSASRTGSEQFREIVGRFQVITTLPPLAGAGGPPIRQPQRPPGGPPGGPGR